MTLEEAEALLAPIREAERVVAEHRKRQELEALYARCRAGSHEWVRNDPRAVQPYCGRCGKVKS